MEMTLSCETWGDVETKRTFWTKGEFLAQVQEMREFFTRNGLGNFVIYGDGIIPWLHKNMKHNKNFLQYKNMKLYSNTNDINQFLKQC